MRNVKSISISKECFFQQNLSSAAQRFRGKTTYLRWLLLAICTLLPGALRAQILIVDCSGANPYAFPTINSALQYVNGPGANVLVTGTCNEEVYVTRASQLELGAWFGQTANIVGGIHVFESDGVYLYGFHVSNPSGFGFDINSSRAVSIDNSTSNANQSGGMILGNLSEVTVVGPSSFDSNGGFGIQMGSHSTLLISDWAGGTSINNNQLAGIWMTHGSLVAADGSVTFANNKTGFGLELLGEAIAQFGTCNGPNLFQGNESGGISLQENSELSLWTCGLSYQTSILSNGPVGISEGFGSQVTLFKNVQISGHTGPAVDLYGASQLNVVGQNLLSQNGTAGDPTSAAIRLDGNSEAFLRGGQISSNQGPAILALMNSSVDFTGVTFGENSEGIITCDSSAYMVSDLPKEREGESVRCRTPNRLGNRHFEATHPAIPDNSLQKRRQAHYKKMATPKPK